MTRTEIAKLRFNQPTTYECVINVLLSLGLERAQNVESIKSELPLLPKEQMEKVISCVKELSRMQPYDLLMFLAKDLVGKEN